MHQRIIRSRQCSTRSHSTGTCAREIPDTTRRRDFAGVLYLFVRGMSSADFPLDGAGSLRRLVVATTCGADRSSK